MSACIDIQHRRFGSWTVIEKSAKPKYWVCRCDCGDVSHVHGKTLRNGSSTQCRKCYFSLRKKTHPLYSTWYLMIDRCENPDAKDYGRYGAVGVHVCDRWHSLDLFVADVGDKPSPEMTLDRIDNSKGYEPGNVRWASKAVQARNRRNNRLVLIDGVAKTIAEWADLFGVKRCTAYWRSRHGYVGSEIFSK